MHNAPPEGEDGMEFIRRVIKGLNDVFQDMMANDVHNAALVIPGGMIMSMLALMGSIASDDRAATPRLLYRETGVLGLPAAIPAKEKRAAVFTAETRQTLRDMMAHNVQETYGQSRFGDLAVCAKSGTAEVSDGAPHAWFVGFVDDNTLPLAFVVVVEHGGSGSDVAGSVAAQLLEQAQS